MTSIILQFGYFGFMFLGDGDLGKIWFTVYEQC